MEAKQSISHHQMDSDVHEKGALHV